MSQSIYHRVSLTQESGGYGVTPATPPMLLVEESSSSPTVTAPKQASATIRADGNIQDVVNLNRVASFARSQELVYPTVSQGFWTEIRGVLRAASEADQKSVAVTTAIDGTLTRAGDSFIADGYQVNDIVELSGCTDTSMNRAWRVATVTDATHIVIAGGAADSFVVDSGTVKRGARMVNGTTNRSYSIEEVWTDTLKMNLWTGQRPAVAEFAFAMGSKATCRIGYVGKDVVEGTMDGNTSVSGHVRGIADAEYTAVTEKPVFDPTQAIYVYSGTLALPVMSASITLATNVRTRHSTAGGATPDAAPAGSFTARVNLTAYAAVLTLLTQYRTGTAQTFWLHMKDSAGNGLSFSFGNLKWDSGGLPTPGMDADAVVTVSGMAYLSEAVDANDQDSTVRFQRFQ